MLMEVQNPSAPSIRKRKEIKKQCPLPAPKAGQRGEGRKKDRIAIKKAKKKATSTFCILGQGKKRGRKQSTDDRLFFYLEETPKEDV